MNGFFLATLDFSNQTVADVIHDDTLGHLKGQCGPLTYQIDYTRSALKHKLTLIDEERYLLLWLGSKPSNKSINELMMHMHQNSLESFQKNNTHFAFLYIDKKTGSCLVLNGKTGAFPIYFYQKDQVLYLSNSQQSLLNTFSDTPKLYHSALFELFYYGLVMPGTTLIQNIHTLSPSVLLIFNGKVKFKKLKTNYDSLQTFSEKKFLELMIDSFEDVIGSEKEVHILSSGGLDSSIMVWVCAQLLNKKVVQHTVSMSDDSNEALYSQKLQYLFNTELVIHTPKTTDVLENITKSIADGESGVMGTLSVNASFESVLTNLLKQYTDQALSGETILFLPPDSSEHNLGLFAGRWSILSKEEIFSILSSNPQMYLHHVQKNARFLNQYTTPEEAFHCQYTVFTSFCGKIQAKYRHPLNHAFSTPLPFCNSRLVDYVNHLVARDAFDYRETIKSLAIQNSTIPPSFYNQPKQWLPSIWQSPEGQSMMTQWRTTIQEENEQAQFLFDPDGLKHLIESKAGSYQERLILSLYYLFYFCKQFDVKF